mgnify:CR=1 FL=1
MGVETVVADLERAASLVRGRPDEVEPDGAPNRFNIPTSTLQSNIWYHLGLAYYMRGEFGEFIDVVPAQQQVGKHWYRGTADSVYQNLDYVRQHHPKHAREQ